MKDSNVAPRDEPRGVGHLSYQLTSYILTVDIDVYGKKDRTFITDNLVAQMSAVMSTNYELLHSLARPADDDTEIGDGVSTASTRVPIYGHEASVTLTVKPTQSAIIVSHECLALLNIGAAQALATVAGLVAQLRSVQERDSRGQPANGRRDNLSVVRIGQP